MATVLAIDVNAPFGASLPNLFDAKCANREFLVMGQIQMTSA